MTSQFEVWAQLHISNKSSLEICRFFQDEYNIEPEYIIPNLHLTVYHSRRPMPALTEIRKSCYHSIDTLDTRFMVLAPGGENPRPSLIPGNRKVGIRIKKDSDFRLIINKYREQFIIHETKEVLGARKASTKSKNAFGARHFQPHISILKSGSGIPTDLTEVGANFRDSIQEIFFDRFTIQKRKNF